MSMCPSLYIPYVDWLSLWRNVHVPAALYYICWRLSLWRNFHVLAALYYICWTIVPVKKYPCARRFILHMFICCPSEDMFMYPSHCITYWTAILREIVLCEKIKNISRKSSYSIPCAPSSSIVIRGSEFGVRSVFSQYMSILGQRNICCKLFWFRYMLTSFIASCPDIKQIVLIQRIFVQNHYTKLSSSFSWKFITTLIIWLWSTLRVTMDKKKFVVATSAVWHSGINQED